MATNNPFDLNLARAFDAPKAFCPRPEVTSILERAHDGRLWTVINGDRRIGKSTSVIVSCVEKGWPILHVDVMGVGSDEEVTERFRWAWQIFQQQASRGLFSALKAEMDATIPGTGVGVRLSSEPRRDPTTWGEVIAAFDRHAAKHGGILFIDELQDLLSIPKSGAKTARSLRAALQMSRNIMPVFAGSSHHLLSPLFDTSAAPFFKSIRIHHDFRPPNPDPFINWLRQIFEAQSRELEVAATDRLFELTDGVTEDLVAACAEIWAQGTRGRTVSPGDVDFAWRCVVNNAAPFFLPKVSALTPIQAHLLRFIAHNPSCQPFSESTVRELRESKPTLHRAVGRLLELEFIRQDAADRSRRVRIHDPRLAFYLRA